MKLKFKGVELFGIIITTRRRVEKASISIDGQDIQIIAKKLREDENGKN